MTKDAIEIVPNDAYDESKSSLALYTKLYEGIVKITQRNMTNNLMAKEAVDLILEDWVFPEDTSLEFNLACLTHWFYKHDTESLKSIDLLQSLRNEGIYLKLKPRTIVNEKVILVNLGPVQVEVPKDYKDDGVLFIKLSDDELPKRSKVQVSKEDLEEESFNRIMAMVEEMKKEQISNPLRAAAKSGSGLYDIQARAEDNIKRGKEINKEWFERQAQQWASRRSSKLLANLNADTVQASIEDLQAPVIEFRNKLYSEVYTEILNRAAELQEQNTTGDLIPELNGLIEALSIVQSLKNSNNHNNSDTTNI